MLPYCDMYKLDQNRSSKHDHDAWRGRLFLRREIDGQRPILVSNPFVKNRELESTFTLKLSFKVKIEHV